ncbi:IclR family transcriptional regulator [Halorarum salinum]|uniref:IclR family transcriptional regulator n=1 Tax=Halorarum salinum TaxID=2743089 RepID=A0A7D5Q8L5_9EURY|nr:IclR family transcriptional regulator [Halobaculum salinum]QLG61057.1 IclR family transcriptional regulator [Halobaculum salinum]
MSQNSSKVKSLETGFRIFEALDELGGAGVTELATEIGVAKSTVHDHLVTMVEGGYVLKEGSEYRISLKFLDHGGRQRDNMGLYKVARPELRELAMDTGELVNLVTEERGLGVYLDLKRGENAVNLDTFLGKREHLHSTAAGKTILANRPESFVNDVIERHGLAGETEQTVTTPPELFDELDVVRERGFALDREEQLRGLCCVAAPITDDEGYALGALSISGPKNRMQPDRLENELADRVTQVANVIEVNLAYS